MKKWVYGLLAVAALIALGLLLRPTPIKVESYKVSRGDFDETIQSDGRVRSKKRQTVYAFGDGNIKNLDVKVGDTVKAGQIVSTLHWDYDIPVKSPMDGVVTKVYRDSAGPIRRGEPVFEVSSLKDLEIVVEILTPNAVRIRQNGLAKILNWGGDSKSDAGTNDEVEAIVSHISRAGAVKLSALGVEEERTEITLSMDRVPEEMKSVVGDAYHVDVRFLIDRIPNAISVPLGALFKTDSQWAVYVVEDGRAILRNIQISVKNDERALVTSGLKEGESVILFPGDLVKPGVRVAEALSSN